MVMTQDITERKQAEEQLRDSEERYRQLVELCPDGIFINRQGKFALVNHSAMKLYGATNPKELLGKPILDLVHPDDQEIVKERIRQLQENTNPVPLLEEKWLRLDGTVFYAEVVAIPLIYQNEPAAQVVIRDISERKRAEKQLHQLNRSLRTISECNQALVRATDEPALLQDICRIIVEFGGYCSAWIAFAEQDQVKSVRPVAQLGFEERFLESLEITWSDTERGRGPTGTAIRTGKVSIVQNILTDPKYMPWREAAIQQGYASSIALPLLVDGKPLGALDIYATEPNAFNQDEVKLLTELANDLAYGITALRTQAEHQQAETALRESKQHLDSILKSIEDVVWSVSATTDELLYLSPATEKVYGRPVQEFFDNPHLWLEVVHPEDYERVVSFNQCLLENGSIDLEYRILQPDGEVRWVYDRGRVTYVNATEAAALAQQTDNARQELAGQDGLPLEHGNSEREPLRSENGYANREIPSDHCLLEHRTPIRLDGIVTDITARKQAELLLKDSEAKFRAFLEAASEAIIVTNANGEIVVFNAKAEELFGYKHTEVLGRTVEFLMPERFHQRHVAHRYGYREQPTKRSMSNTTNLLARRKDGTEFPIEAGLSPVQTKDGTFVMTFLTDITERKQAEEEIKRLNESLERRVVEVETRYEQIVELAEEGIWVIDRDAKTTYVNHAMARMLGYTEAEMLGRPMFDFMDEAEHQTAHTNVERRQQGIAAKHESKLKTRDGQTLWTYMSTSPVLDDDGNLLWSCALVYDITERKKADDQLRESAQRISLANAELARATRLKDEFLASMSHELRTPLNAILGLAEALQEEVYGSLTDKQRRSLGTIEQSGRHLLELITDILDLSKIESGKMELQMTLASPESLCESSLTFVKQQAHHKSIKLSSKIPEGLGDIEVDERRIRQVLVNLLSNAVKFTPEGGEVRVEVEADPEAEILEFSVIDTGIGIAQENLDKLFKPFVQLDSSLSRRYAGTGLGLALVRRIVELHGGSVSLESEIEKGSRFTLTLPWKEPEQMSPSVRETEQALLQLPSIHNALIVEDSETAAKQVARYLAEMGSAAFIHPQGEGAVEAVVRFDPEVIILDLLLPHLSGWEVLTQLKANPATQHIPVLVISVVDERSRALQLGASEYLVKPISRKQLQSTLSKIFASAPQRSSHAALVVMPEEERQLPLILLAEDNEANISTVIDYLQIHGFRVGLARNGIEAVQMARQDKPELILMDIQMPEMDGLEATRRIHGDADLANIPIIALTSLAMPGDREKCLAAGARDYLTKPVSLKKLVNIIAQYISPSNSQLENRS
jgi:PAS domain S-box-containing protein